MATFPNSNPLPQSELDHSPTPLRIGFWICIVIAVAVVLRRLFALAAPSHSGPPQMAGLDDSFASHAALTLAHIIPALFFVLLSPFVVFSRFARLQWPERILFPLGTIVGLTAYPMSAYAVGGWIERSGVFFFDTLFLYSLARAFWHRQRGEPILKRRWLLRSIAILLGIATTRPVMGVFFATSAATHLVPSQFFGIAFWIGFSINTLVFEFWLRSAARRFQPLSAAVPGLSTQDHPGRGRGYSR
jgi:hypothetical protein